jgi:hypothetical protein
MGDMDGSSFVPENLSGVETSEAAVEAMLQAENEWLSEPSDESYTADEWDVFRARHMLDAVKPHLVARIQIGWWHWFDGDLTKRGAFRYDHPGHGISVPAYRPATPPGDPEAQRPIGRPVEEVIADLRTYESSRRAIEEAIDQWQEDTHWWGDSLPSKSIAVAVVRALVRVGTEDA